MYKLSEREGSKIQLRAGVEIRSYIGQSRDAEVCCEKRAIIGRADFPAPTHCCGLFARNPANSTLSKSSTRETHHFSALNDRFSLWSCRASLALSSLFERCRCQRKVPCSDLAAFFDIDECTVKVTLRMRWLHRGVIEAIAQSNPHFASACVVRDPIAASEV
jgi:hypothetical protein